MKIKIIKPGVTDASSVLEVGAVVEYPDAVAASLIKGGYAEATESNGGSGELTPETAAKKLNKYKVDELIGFAVDHGVELKDDATKAEIVDALIKAEVYAEILG